MNDDASDAADDPAVASQRDDGATVSDTADADTVRQWPAVDEVGLAADGVWKRYDAAGWALRDVTLPVPERGVHVLAGPNGSGKSTLLSLLTGVAAPDRGQVKREGSVGLAFQEPSVHPTLTVAENLSTFGALSGGDPEPVAERLRLEPVRDRRAERLSGGYRRLLDLALAVAKHPDYLLLDEPLASLDDDSRHRVVSLVREEREHCGVVVVAHRLRVLAPLVDTLTVLVDGEVVARERAAAVDDLQAWYAERAGLD